ncbi:MULTISPECIES: hypothetical protein [Bacillaceae]|nr:hypothetical protein [Bacillus badius]
MNMRNDVFDRIKTTKRRVSEAEKILAYLEKMKPLKHKSLQ